MSWLTNLCGLLLKLYRTAVVLMRRTTKTKKVASTVKSTSYNGKAKLKVLGTLSDGFDDSEDSNPSKDSSDDNPWPLDRNPNLAHQPGTSSATCSNLAASSNMNTEMEIDDDVTRFDLRMSQCCLSEIVLLTFQG
ncbi:hypothetical protein DFH28DRAFT_921360 [Melampsora americana]|nr:hypothetical protein DFH28DRAFT_921360 [Melampsora americana]